MRAPNTDSHHVVGTPLYLSAEAIQGEDANALFDLWSLAVVLYESLTGTNPFLGQNIFETLDRIVRVTSADVRAAIPECPEPVAAFFAEALAKDRGRRPASAAEFRARLASAVGENPAPEPPTPADRKRTSCPGRSRRCIACHPRRN